MSNLSELKNIGKTTEGWLNEAGIHTIADLEELGAVEAWKRMKAVHPAVNLNGLYALQAALLDIHWNALPEDMKADLRAQVEG